MKEIWKDIEGYKGLYQVSNMGRVKSLERTVRCDRGYRIIPERILKTGKNNCGYLHVQLCKEGKVITCRVHRLVAQAFIENPNNLPVINHKDEDKTNNCVDNLEFCSYSYNNSYGTGNKKRAKKLSKPVIGISKSNGLILEFPSLMEASRQVRIDQCSICKCCQGRRKSAKGYYWHYVDSEEVANEK